MKDQPGRASARADSKGKECRRDSNPGGRSGAPCTTGSRTHLRQPTAVNQPPARRSEYCEPRPECPPLVNQRLFRPRRGVGPDRGRLAKLLGRNDQSRLGNRGAPIGVRPAEDESHCAHRSKNPGMKNQSRDEYHHASNHGHNQSHSHRGLQLPDVLKRLRGPSLHIIRNSSSPNQ